MNQFAKNLPPKLFIHTKQLRILESVGQGVCVYMCVCVGVRCVGGRVLLIFVQSHFSSDQCR